MAYFGNPGERIPMKVLAAKEGDIYELNPFIFIEDDEIDCHDRGLSESDSSVSITGSSSQMVTTFNNQRVLLGLCQTDSGFICDALKSSVFEVTVVQESSCVLTAQPLWTHLCVHFFFGLRNFVMISSVLVLQDSRICQKLALLFSYNCVVFVLQCTLRIN